MKFRQSNSTMTGVALVAGIAIGAAIGALFAPRSGNDSRKLLTDTIDRLLGTVEDIQETDIKDHLVEDVRMNAKSTADKLTGDADHVPDLTRTTIKQTDPKSRQLPIESSEA